MKRNLGMRFISYLLVFVLVFSGIVVNPENIMASGFTIPTLVATTNNEGIGSVQLNWSNNAPYGYFYKGLFSKDGIDWGPMPMLDLNNIQSTSDKVRVLQIYPDSGSGQLISWMITNGYGKML